VSDSVAFFDRYSRLRTTSTTDVRGERLEYRYRALIERNRAVISGKRVLDLASHDGRWMLAALDAGAVHVAGIEGRAELVERSRSTFHGYEVAEERYALIAGDCLRCLQDVPPGAFDTVFCFGFLYHTLQHYELLRAITLVEPATLLIDSRVVPIDEPAIWLAANDTRLEGAAIGRVPGEETVLVGVPTRGALLLMLNHLRWHAEVQPILPPASPEGEGVRDYCEGRRVNIVATRP
jgi:2-polyprenyl-3-methyl-5-hydroxy-6-metoxy-1,4-benzoquinol methylase